MVAAHSDHSNGEPTGSAGGVTISPGQKYKGIVVVAVALLFLLPEPAHAYLDPGSGSFLLQILIAGLLGAGVAVKAYWRRIKSWFSRSSGNQTDSKSDG